MTSEKSEELNSNQHLVVVGITCSTQDLVFLPAFFEQLDPSEEGYAIVFAQHLHSPDHSGFSNWLSAISPWPVSAVNNQTTLKSQTVYFPLENHEVTFTENNKIELKKSSERQIAIATFFSSLADQYKSHAISVSFSPLGSFAEKAIEIIKSYNGLVLANPFQDANSSEPSTTGRAKILSHECRPAEMPDLITDHINKLSDIHSDSDVDEGKLYEILQLLQNRCRTDFSQYKPSTIGRRLEKRMHDLKINNTEDYLAKIKDSTEELQNLFATLLIGVTEFFRDPKAFDALRITLEARLKNNEDKSLRIWTVGCASGEEPYSIAMLISEILGENIKNYSVQIFATDINERALAVARKGFYPTDLIKGLTDEQLQQYFIREKDGFEVKKSLKQMVLFSKHDITNDPPFVRLDYISCRNVLIYFKSELQKEVIPIFHYALRKSGYLLLGKSENVAQVSNLFHNSEENVKLFQRKDDVELNTLNFKAFQREPTTTKNRKISHQSEKTLLEMAEETIVKTYEHPYMILDPQMEVAQIVGSLQPYLDLSDGAINSNVLKILNQRFHTEVRTLFIKVKRDAREAKSNVLRYVVLEKEFYVRLVVKPLLHKKNYKEYFLLIFEQIDDESRYPINKDLLQNKDFRQEIRIMELEQELQVSREHLRTFAEELEANNEELQSLNEEMQSANEELKSTNEELETSNEELQSMNEELHTSNTDLNTANQDLHNKELQLSKSENELKQTNSKFHLLLSNSNIFMACQNKELGYEWVYNQSKQYSLQDLYGVTDEQLFQDEATAQQFISLKKKVLKTKKEEVANIFFNDQYWTLTVRPWYEQDRLNGILVLAVNMTAEKSSQQLLELRRKTIDALIEDTGDYILIVDKNTSVQVISKSLRRDLELNMNLILDIDSSLTDPSIIKNRATNLLIDPISKALAGEMVRISSFRGFSSDPTKNHFSVNVFPLKGVKNEVLGAAFVGNDISQLITSKNRIQEILKRGSKLTEKAYFVDLTQQIYEWFGCKCIYVGPLKEQSTALSTFAFRMNGVLIPNISFELEGKPCEMVKASDKIQLLYDVKKQYPEDKRLQDWNAGSYVGIPISSPVDGDMLGMIVMISEGDIKLSSDDEYLLTILALRAGAELLRSRNTQELLQRDQQLEKITLNSPDMIYEFEILSNREERFNYISKAIEKIFELSASEVHNDVRSIYDCIHSDDIERFMEVSELNLLKLKHFQWIGRIVTKKTRKVKWIRISSNPERLENGSTIWNGIIDDISHQKEIEHQLQQAKELAEEAAGAKEDFLATMSHEIRTPLNAIYGITELLQINPKTKNIEHLDVLKYNTESLLSLVNNILDFSKIKAKSSIHPIVNLT